ncbi:MAG: hypothetical protein V1728_00965 [Candidatus Micrarchaeota archaeon]
MSDTFAIREVDEKTRRFIHVYARRRGLRAAKALKELVDLAQARLREKEKAKPKYKYRSLMDAYKKFRFTSDDPHLSEHIDDVVYGD